MNADQLAEMLTQLDTYGVLQHLTADEVEAVRDVRPQAVRVTNQFDPNRFDLLVTTTGEQQ